MNNRFKTYNTLYKTLDQTNTNLLYRPSNTVFDLIITLLDINVYNCYSSNIMDHCYDAYMASNVLEHSNKRNGIVLAYGVPDIVCFHNPLPSAFKKEDLYILKKSSTKNFKIFFDDVISSGWSIKDRLSYNINYGIPAVNTDLNNTSNHKKSIIVLNLDNNNSVDTLYQYIKNVYKDAEMITDISTITYEDLVNKLSEYHTCLEHSSLINCLVAAYAGCHLITSLSPIEGISGSFNITDYTSIIDQIKTSLIRNSSLDRSLFLDKYSFDLFSSKFTKCIKEIKKAPLNL